MTSKIQPIHVGSTRDVFVGTPGNLVMEMSPYLSAFDVGTCPHRFDAIDVLRIDFAEKFFEMLSKYGISHNFVQRIGPRTIEVTEFRRYVLRDGEYHLLEPFSRTYNGTLIPLEFIVRYRVATKGFLKRLEDPNDPLTWERIGVSKGSPLAVGDVIPLFVECSTKLEKPKDRYLSDQEACTIGKLNAKELVACKRLAERVGELLNDQASKNGQKLFDFKIEIAMKSGSKPVVADLLSPDEMRIVDACGVSRDKDIFRTWLNSVGFKDQVEAIRAQAKFDGIEPVYPPYPVVPSYISAAVTQGYREAVQMFWA